MSEQGFTDLRLNGNRDQPEGGYWPSFADMMTVIAMIFMLTMVVLVYSNWDLLNKLQNSVLLEEKLEKKVEQSSKENQQLASKLSAQESQISYLQMQIYNLQGDLDQANQVTAAKVDEIKALEAKNQEGKRTLDESLAKVQLLSDELKVALDEKVSLQNNIAVQAQALNELNVKLGAVEKKYHDEALAKDLAFSELKKKYDRLVRPARSSAGKVLVEVNLSKTAAGQVILLKGPDEEKPVVVSHALLHEKLKALKEKYPHKIYLKIIFPDGNKLSHSEAWNFTQELLSRYDYYYEN